MAMSVEQAFVAECFSPSLTLRSDVIDFDHIGILKEQLAPTTFPSLLAQQGAFYPIKEGVGAQSLAPIEEISVVGTCRSFHLDMLLDVCLSVFPQRGFLASKLPAFSFPHMPVFVCHPAPSFVGMAVFGPPSQLQVEHVVTGMEGL